MGYHVCFLWVCWQMTQSHKLTAKPRGQLLTCCCFPLEGKFKKKKKIAYQKHSWRTTGHKIEAGQPPHAEDIRYFWLSVIKRSILDGKADFYHPNLLSFFCIAQSWAKALKKKEYQEKNPWCKIFLCFLHPVSVKLTQHFKKRSIMVKHGGGSVMSGVALLREDLNNSS